MNTATFSLPCCQVPVKRDNLWGRSWHFMYYVCIKTLFCTWTKKKKEQKPANVLAFFKPNTILLHHLSGCVCGSDAANKPPAALDAGGPFSSFIRDGNDLSPWQSGAGKVSASLLSRLRSSPPAENCARHFWDVLRCKSADGVCTEIVAVWICLMGITCRQNLEPLKKHRDPHDWSAAV